MARVAQKHASGFQQPRQAALERRRLRCTGGWKSYGHDGEQLTLTPSPCTCRAMVDCMDCGERHTFVARCEACAAAGKPGVPWNELPGRAA